MKGSSVPPAFPPSDTSYYKSLRYNIFIGTAAVPTCAVPPISVQHPQTGRRRYVTQEERESLPPCGGTVEPKGYHHLGQCKTGTHNPINRHNAILRIIVKVLRSLNIVVRSDGGTADDHVFLDTFMEDHFGRRATGGKHHRPDAIFTLPHAPAATILDVSVGDFRAKATGRARGTPLAAGVAARAAEQDKNKDHESAQQPGQQPAAMAKSQLVPAVLTNMGAPSESLTKFVTALASISSRRAAAQAAAAAGGEADLHAVATGHGPQQERRAAAARLAAVRGTGDVDLHAERTVAHLMARITAVLWREQAGAILEARRFSAGHRYGLAMGCGADMYGRAGRASDLDLSRAAMVWVA